MKNAYVLLFLAIVAEVAATSFERGPDRDEPVLHVDGALSGGRASTQASARSG